MQQHPNPPVILEPTEEGDLDRLIAVLVQVACNIVRREQAQQVVELEDEERAA